MIKQCKKCSHEFEITKEDFEFYDKMSPVFNWIKYQIPKPLNCPECREQRRQAWRNERILYKRKCNAVWKNIISMHSESVDFPVYHNKYWWNDKNDTTKYGQNPDFNKSFFSQYLLLRTKVPRMHRFSYSEDRMENSEYTNCAWDLKNCYLVFWAWRNEQCYYSHYINDCFKCVDCFYVIKSQNCYQCVDLDNCTNLFYSNTSKRCSDSYFLENCRDCNNCIWCVNLRSKEYCILNKQYNQKEYEKIKNEIFINSKNINEFNKKYKAFALKHPKIYIKWENIENSTWDYISNSTNVINCFDTMSSQDCKYCTWFEQWSNCMDFFSWWESQWCYEISWWWQNSYNSAFCAMMFWCNDSYYLDLCFYCKNCFLCVWLKNKQYCILNKQYTKKQYEIIVAKIIEKMKLDNQWWEFFPTHISPFYYNESVAQEYFPLNKNQIINSWWNFLEENNEIIYANKTIPSEKLPDSINDIPDDILNWTIKCKQSQKLFKITPQELKFYRENNIPIPHLHPNERHKTRVNLRNPRKLFERECDKCEKIIQTSFPPGKPEIVYCEQCYLKEVY